MCSTMCCAAEDALDTRVERWERSIMQDEPTTPDLGRTKKILGIEISGTGIIVEIGERESLDVLVDQWCDHRGYRPLCWTLQNRILKWSSQDAYRPTVRAAFPSRGDMAFFSYDNFAVNFNSAMCFRSIYELDRSSSSGVYPRLTTTPSPRRRYPSQDSIIHTDAALGQ